MVRNKSSRYILSGTCWGRRHILSKTRDVKSFGHQNHSANTNKPLQRDHRYSYKIQFASHRFIQSFVNRKQISFKIFNTKSILRIEPRQILNPFGNFGSGSPQLHSGLGELHGERRGIWPRNKKRRSCRVSPTNARQYNANQ